VFTDDDCLPDSEWLYNYYLATRRYSSGAFEGCIKPLGDLNQDMVECPVNLDGRNFWSANIMINNALFREVDGFDENYPYAANEDEDLFFRLKPKTDIPFINDAIVVHPVRVLSIGQFLNRIPKVLRSWAYHVVKNGQLLGISSLRRAFYCSFIDEIFVMAQCIRHKRMKKLICTLYGFFVGLPYLGWRLWITNHRHGLNR
jgi:GT2 family glycosyltransferase